jgi:hypothetical protein
MSLAGALKKQVGPIYLTVTLTTNVYNNNSSLIYDNIKHLEVVNTTGSAATFTLYISTTGDNTGGREWFKGQSVAANSTYHWYGNKKLVSTDFVVGGSGTGSALTIMLEGEQVVV